METEAYLITTTGWEGEVKKYYVRASELASMLSSRDWSGVKKVEAESQTKYVSPYAAAPVITKVEPLKRHITAGGNIVDILGVWSGSDSPVLMLGFEWEACVPVARVWGLDGKCVYASPLDATCPPYDSPYNEPRQLLFVTGEAPPFRLDASGSELYFGTSDHVRLEPDGRLTAVKQREPVPDESKRTDEIRDIIREAYEAHAN